MILLDEGNPTCGMTFVGPFATEEAAEAYRDIRLGDGKYGSDWGGWVIELQAPKE